MDQWAWGKIAGPQVQRMAQSTNTDGTQDPDLLRWARFGSNGVCPGNCHRDLQRFFKTVRQDVKYCCNGIATGDDTGEVETVNVPMMPLHRLLACCYEHHRHAFARRCAGSDGAIVTFLFGKGVGPEDPKLMAWALALAQTPSYRTHCIP